LSVKNSLLNATMSIDRDNVKSKKSYSETCTYECTPIYFTLCIEVGDPLIEICGEPEQIGETCTEYCYPNPQEPDYPEEPVDFCMDPANFYFCNPENPGNPDVPVPNPTENPCDRKAGVETAAANPMRILKDNQIKVTITSSTNPTGKEFGVDHKLTSLTGTPTYKDVAVTPGIIGKWFPGQFTWSATDGYTIGDSHSHIDGNAPSPSDIFDMAKNLSNPAVIASGTSGISFYKQNVSSTVITQYGNYVVTVKDWAAFMAEYALYKNNTVTYNNTYDAIGDSLSIQPAGFRFLTKFAGFLNLFKADPQSGVYKPLRLNSQGAIELFPCPTN
jgi:hypothetical protein